MVESASDMNITFHRGDLQKALLDHLGQFKKVQTAKRLVSYSQPEVGTPGPITLQFKDGSTATCDVLVGADGIRSAVRSTMYSQLADAALAANDATKAEKLRTLIPPLFSGNIIYRTLVRKDALPEESAAHPAFNRRELMAVSDEPHISSLFLTFGSQYCGKNKVNVNYGVECLTRSF